MRLLRRILIPMAAITALLGPMVPASAITGGVSDGEAHPNVAMLLFYGRVGADIIRVSCTGTLVSPTVVLTAGHCTTPAVGKVLITFQSVIAQQPPSGLPRASDDLGTGTSSIGYQGVPSPNTFAMYSGTARTHPGYSNFTDKANWNDVGVVLLDQTVPASVVPGRIAPAGYLDAFAQPLLNKTLFTTVGYGTFVDKSATGPQNPVPQNFPFERRNTTSQGQKLTPQILQVNGNPNNVQGGGGSCFGDSGGPSLLNGLQVSIVSFGRTENCRYLDGLQRVDIPVVLDWLATFGITPSK